MGAAEWDAGSVGLEERSTELRRWARVFAKMDSVDGCVQVARKGRLKAGGSHWLSVPSQLCRAVECYNK